MMSEKEWNEVLAGIVDEGRTVRSYSMVSAELIAGACRTRVGIWQDSIGFAISGLDAPVQRPDAVLVREVGR